MTSAPSFPGILLIDLRAGGGGDVAWTLCHWGFYWTTWGKYTARPVLQPCGVAVATAWRCHLSGAVTGLWSFSVVNRRDLAQVNEIHCERTAPTPTNPNTQIGFLAEGELFMNNVKCYFLFSSALILKESHRSGRHHQFSARFASQTYTAFLILAENRFYIHNVELLLFCITRHV